jgi:hypothetical protein
VKVGAVCAAADDGTRAKKLKRSEIMIAKDTEWNRLASVFRNMMKLLSIRGQLKKW